MIDTLRGLRMGDAQVLTVAAYLLWLYLLWLHLL